MAWVPAAIQAGGALLGGLMGSSAQSRANKQNIQLQREQRGWEEMMSNTAYVRGTRDMLAAGLNPMLAYSQGGASTPSVSAATVHPEDAMAKGIASAADKAAQVYATKKMMYDADQAQTKAASDRIDLANKEAQQHGTDAQHPANAAMLQRQAETTAKEETAKQAKIRTEMDLTAQRIQQIEERVARAIEGFRITSAQQQARALEQQANFTQIQALLAKLDIPEKKAIADWFNTVGAASPATKAVMSVGQWLKFILGDRQ